MCWIAGCSAFGDSAATHRALGEGAGGDPWDAQPASAAVPASGHHAGAGAGDGRQGRLDTPACRTTLPSLFMAFRMVWSVAAWAACHQAAALVPSGAVAAARRSPAELVGMAVEALARKIHRGHFGAGFGFCSARDGCARALPPCRRRCRLNLQPNSRSGSTSSCSAARASSGH